MKLPPYNIYPKVTGDTISLRQIEISDLEDIIDISFYDRKQASTLEQATEIHHKIEQNYNDGDSIHWGITDNLTNKLVGTCGYYRGLDKGEGELGCVLLSEHRGKGYMTSALSLAIEFGLNNIELNRIWAITTKQNTKAIQLLERLNFNFIAELDDDQVEFELKR